MTFLSGFYLNFHCALEFGSLAPFLREELPGITVCVLAGPLWWRAGHSSSSLVLQTPISVNKWHLPKSLYTKISPGSFIMLVFVDDGKSFDLEVN